VVAQGTRYRRTFLAIVAFVLLGCSRLLGDPKVAIVAPGGVERAAVRVELAVTEAQQEVGLMYRNHLDEDAGMIFIFPGSAQRAFWMKNTEIPLDMLFADGDARVVGIVANAEPYTETPRTVAAAAKYVLEVNGGFCSRHHVATGDRLRFDGFDPQGHL